MSRVLKGISPTLERPWLPAEPAPPAPEPDLTVIAEEIRQRAEQEAAEMLAAARDEADAIRRNAHDEGFARGLDGGEKAYDARIEEMQALIEEINQEREAFFDRIEPSLVRLSLVIAEKVIAQQIAIKPELVVDLARSHVKRLREREVVRIRVNPEDMPMLAEGRKALLAEVDGLREIQLFDDRRVGRGSLVIEAQNGSLDARIPSQLDVIKDALEEALEVPHEHDASS